jgi:flagellar basal-body rod protein FlgF
MENALLIGLSRQVALTRELEAVANNIANLNTTGFKADGTIFEEFLMPVARDNQFSRADSRVSFVRDRATFHDLTQGPVQQTGNPLDVAIAGNAFFAVQTANGERYTRNGAFQITPNGELVTSEGDRVLGEGGPIQFQNTDNSISIARDGTIRVREGSSATVDAARGKLRLVTFDRPGQLQKDGGSRFVAPNGMQAQPAPLASVTQGAIEKSNVRAVVEMTRMIEITRTYTQVANLLQQQSEMRRTVIEKLGSVPA